MEGDSMTQFESLKRCCHCGAVIQSDDPKKEGYLSLETLNEISDREVLLCDSCYQKQRYNRSPAPMKTSEGILTMLKDAKASDALIVQVIDLTSFECSFDQNAAEFAKNLKYIIIGNKKDLMPKNYSDEDLKEHICNVYGEYGIKLSKDDIFLTSLLFSNDVSDITKAIERKRNGHDVYILGDVSSGKSLFFSAFLKNYKNRSNHPVGVSRYFGTDLDVLKIPLDSSSFIYDTPGNLLSNSFTRYKDDPSLMKYILTDKPYISKKVSISLNGSIFISNLARIDYLEGKKHMNFFLHVSPKIQCKGITPKNNMDELFLKYSEKRYLKPCAGFLKSMSDYDVFDIKLKGEEYQELAISGLGWVSFQSDDGIKLRIYVPKGIGLYAGKAKGHRYVNSKK